MTIRLRAPLPTCSSCRPGRRGEAPHVASLFGIAPGGACRAGPVARPAVGSYPTVSPLLVAVRTRTAERSVLCGAFPRVSPAGRYPAPLLHGVRTFLEVETPRPSSHPRAHLLAAEAPCAQHPACAERCVPFASPLTAQNKGKGAKSACRYRVGMTSVSRRCALGPKPAHPTSSGARAHTYERFVNFIWTEISRGSRTAAGAEPPTRPAAQDPA